MLDKFHVFSTFTPTYDSTFYCKFVTKIIMINNREEEALEWVMNIYKSQISNVLIHNHNLYRYIGRYTG